MHSLLSRNPPPSWTRAGFLAALVLAVLPACTAARASYYVVDAERNLHAAARMGAEERAVYEYTLAKEYLWKAKEEVNASDYGSAEQLCKKSIEYAALALERADDKGERVKGAEDFVPEVKPEEPEEEEEAPELNIDLDDL